MHRCLIAGLLALALSPPAVADFAAGLTAAKNSDYATAMAEWRPLAEAGDALSQYNLALLYAQGHGVEKDYATAAEWVRRAAEQGMTKAQALLGTFYAKGLGVEEDLEAAAGWLYQAATQDDAGSQYDLAVLYANGQGVARDFTQAYMWFAIASAQGYPPAVDSQRKLKGMITPQEVELAERMAADFIRKRRDERSAQEPSQPSKR